MSNRLSLLGARSIVIVMLRLSSVRGRPRISGRANANGANVENLRTAPRSVIPTVLSMPEFTEGSRYTDYVPSTDKVAAYGIGGLIAGSIAQKLGLFALALAFLKKGWIVILMVLAGAWKAVGRLFTRKQPE